MVLLPIADLLCTLEDVDLFEDAAMLSSRVCCSDSEMAVPLLGNVDRVSSGLFNQQWLSFRHDGPPRDQRTKQLLL